jgi:hypothetical protein
MNEMRLDMISGTTHGNADKVECPQQDSIKEPLLEYLNKLMTILEGTSRKYH